MDDNGEPVAKVEEVMEEVHHNKNSEMLLLRGRGNQAWESSLNASSGGRGRRWLGIQHDRRGVQLFGQSIAVKPFSQSSTRNLHRACTNLDTSSRAQSGSVICERCPCHQMDYAPQGVEGLLYVDVLPSAEAPGV